MPPVSRFRPTIALPRIPVAIYDPMSFCFDLTLLNPGNIIQIFMNYYISLSGLTVVSFDSKFKSLSLTPVSQPPADVQNAAYDTGLPYIFLYLASLICKNPTASLTRYLRSREIGLRRALARIGIIPPIGNYIIPNVALVELQDFMTTNPNVMGHVFEVFLGFCNPDNESPVTSYAIELVGQIRFANMSSVELIEDYLLIPRHPCLQDRQVQGDLIYYNRFKSSMIVKYGTHDWIYSALLDKSSWLNYSRTRSHERLRIISGMFASDEHHTYDNLQISGNTISYYKGVGIFNTIYNTYTINTQGRHQGANAFGTLSDAVEISRRADAWTKSLNLNPGN